MKTAVQIVNEYCARTGCINVVHVHSVVEMMEEYARQSIETTSFSYERLQEIAESKLEEAQEKVRPT